MHKKIKYIRPYVDKITDGYYIYFSVFVHIFIRGLKRQETNAGA